MKVNLDDIMKKKYDEIEIPNLEYDEIIYRKKNKYSIYKVAVIIVFLVAGAIAIKSINKKDVENISNNVLSEEVALNSNNVSTVYNDDIFLPRASETITIAPMGDIASIAQLDVDYVSIVKVNKILGYTNYSQIQNRYTNFPITWLEVEVENTLKGELYGTIKINKYGGIISLSDYEKALTDAQKEKQGYNEKTEEEKRNTYVEIVNTVMLSMPKVEIGKSYLVFLKNDEVYGGIGVSGFFMKEYDKNTNSIKEYNETWVKIEDSLLIKQALEK